MLKILSIAFVATWLSPWLSPAPVCCQDKPDAGKQEHAAKSVSNPQFDRLKTLVGEWVPVESDTAAPAADATVEVRYALTSAGNTVMETLFPGTPHEMITMYYLDGNDLVLTHYCGLANQPHMKADKSADAARIAFKFVSGSNINAAKDMHMHDVAFEFVTSDHYKMNWQLWADGKATELKKFNLKRKKG